MSAGDPSANLWRPRGDWLRLRAATTEKLRQFFAGRGVLEVRTPCLSRCTTTAPHLQSIAAGDLWLRTSPEHHMKRLLAADSGDIWQLGPCFRADEAGRLHNPEFEMLEWYRLGLTLAEMQAETKVLVDTLLGEAPWSERCCRDFMQEEWGLDPWADSAEAFRQRALAEGAPQFAADADEAAPWRDFLLEKRMQECSADERLLLYGYPPDQAELAAIVQRDGRPEAARFEVWIGGVELANGAEELLDAQEAEARMQAENRRRAEAVAVDEHLLEAMRQGLPACCGTALGFDRLLMLAAGASALPLGFPADRA